MILLCLKPLIKGSGDFVFEMTKLSARVRIPSAAPRTPSVRFDEFLKAKELAPTTISYKIGLIRHLELRFNLWDSEIIKRARANRTHRHCYA